MKKSTKKTTNSNLKDDSELESHLNKSEINPINQSRDEFILFSLDVQETNNNSFSHQNLNTVNSNTDDFILFQLDINKTSSNTNKPKTQNVTKTNLQSIVVNPQTSTSPIPINNPNNKLRNIFFAILIGLSIYTINNKESKEIYGDFLNKTIYKIGNSLNNLKSNFRTENDFVEYKKSKRMIYNPYLEYIEEDSGEINEIKGDSIIIIEPTGKSLRSYFLAKGKPFKLKISTDEGEYSKERLATEKMELDIDQNSFESTNNYSGRINVFLLNTGFFSQEISVWKNDVSFENSDNIEVKFMRNRYEDYKKNTILKKYISKSLLINSNQNTSKNSEIDSKINIMTATYIKHEWIENDMFTFKDKNGKEIYFNDVPQNCILYDKNGINKKYYNMKFKIKWEVDKHSYEYPINRITQIELIK